MTKAAPTSPPRPAHERRSEYRAAHQQEMFIVPLVKQAIDETLVAHGKPPHPASRALDVRCGRQPFRAALQNLGHQYHSMDVEQNAEATVGHLGPIDQPLPASLAGETFDLLLVTEVLEHVADWSAAFANFSRLLAPGGTLIITTPFVYPLHEVPYDFWRPTLEAIRHFGEREGLEAIAARTIGEPSDVLGTVLAATRIMPVSGSLMSRFTSKFFNLIRRIAIRRLHQRRWHGRVRFESEMYLSNVAVFRKRREP